MKVAILFCKHSLGILSLTLDVFDWNVWDGHFRLSVDQTKKPDTVRNIPPMLNVQVQLLACFFENITISGSGTAVVVPDARVRSRIKTEKAYGQLI